jgi:hypothetical protein
VAGPRADRRRIYDPLIARTRGGWLEPLARKVPVIGPLLWPIAALIERGPGQLLHHYMESGMLLGIKARVETSALRLELSAGDVR